MRNLKILIRILRVIDYFKDGDGKYYVRAITSVNAYHDYKY